MRPKTDGLSKRGRQSQSIEPSLPTSAAELESDSIAYSAIGRKPFSARTARGLATVSGVRGIALTPVRVAPLTRRRWIPLPPGAAVTDRAVAALCRDAHAVVQRHRPLVALSVRGRRPDRDAQPHRRCEARRRSRARARGSDVRPRACARRAGARLPGKALQPDARHHGPSPERWWGR